MVGGTHFIVLIMVVVVVDGKPRVRGQKVTRKEKSQDSCVQIEEGMDLPDHCKEYCIAIRSMRILFYRRTIQTTHISGNSCARFTSLKVKVSNSCNQVGPHVNI
jgi:hypothetical protein